MPIYLWPNPASPYGKSILIRAAFGNKIAIAEECCCEAGGCPDRTANQWSSVSVNGCSLAKGAAYVVCNDGCGASPLAGTTPDNWWFAECSEVQHWVWSDSVDETCDLALTGTIVYHYSWCDCETGQLSHTQYCCTQIWNGSTYVLGNPPYTATITP